MRQRRDWAKRARAVGDGGSGWGGGSPWARVSPVPKVAALPVGLGNDVQLGRALLLVLGGEDAEVDRAYASRAAGRAGRRHAAWRLDTRRQVQTAPGPYLLYITT